MSKFGGYEDQPFMAEFYDFMPAYVTRGDVEFFISFSRACAGRTLELGCGTGRVLIPTAEAGCEIVGLDLSEYMLARCREKLSRTPEKVQSRVRLVQGTMTDFDLGGKFSLITVPFRPFQHLVAIEDQIACLRCANRHLECGGALILDLFQPLLRYLADPGSSEEIEDAGGVPLPGGRVMRRTRRLAGLHSAEQYMDAELCFYITHPDGREERFVQAFPFRYFFRYEVEHLLERCGFNVANVFGNYDKSPLADGSPEMIFVATKARDLA
jgi:SAM-dependent methyltransferase